MKKNAIRLLQVAMDVIIGVGTYTIFAKTIAKLIISVLPEAGEVSTGLSVLIGFVMVAFFAEYFEIKPKE